jgi:hypothetical protein
VLGGGKENRIINPEMNLKPIDHIMAVVLVLVGEWCRHRDCWTDVCCQSKSTMADNIKNQAAESIYSTIHNGTVVGT